MPDVVGSTTEQAAAALAALGLGPVGFVDAAGAVEDRPGTVVRSSTAAGSDIRPGDRIALTVEATSVNLTPATPRR
jgi:beta-lactam-binding protein with PASTA domain